MPIFKDINLKLFDACSRNDAKKVEEYLKNKKCDPNWQNKDELNQSAIHIASSKGFTLVVNSLIVGGADVNLLDDEKVSPLHKAVRSNCIDAIQRLLDAKAEVNSISGKTQATVLFAACKEGNVSLVKLLLTRGADVNLGSVATGQTPLAVASRNGQVKIVGLLLKAGAAVNTASREGATPVFEASLKGHVRVLEALLPFKPDLNAASSEGVTPLMAAASEGHAMVSKMLILNKADVNLRNKEGLTALYKACEKNNGKIVEQLIDAGSCLDGLNQTSPLYIATLNGHNEIVSLIVNAARTDALKNKKSVLTTRQSLQKIKSLLKVEASKGLNNTNNNNNNNPDSKGALKRSVTFLQSDESIVDILTSTKAGESAATSDEESTCLTMANTEKSCELSSCTVS